MVDAIELRARFDAALANKKRVKARLDAVEGGMRAYMPNPEYVTHPLALVREQFVLIEELDEAREKTRVVATAGMTNKSALKAG